MNQIIGFIYPKGINGFNHVPYSIMQQNTFEMKLSYNQSDNSDS